MRLYVTDVCNLEIDGVLELCVAPGVCAGGDVIEYRSHVVRRDADHEDHDRGRRQHAAQAVHPCVYLHTLCYCTHTDSCTK